MVADLVERFSRDRKAFLSGDYKEEQLRAEFLNPVFTALGWDVDNTIDMIPVRNWGGLPAFPLFFLVLLCVLMETDMRRPTKVATWERDR